MIELFGSLWARRCATTGGTDVFPQAQGPSFYFFFLWKKGSPLQGGARTDLPRKLCSIGNGLQW